MNHATQLRYLDHILESVRHTIKAWQKEGKMPECYGAEFMRQRIKAAVDAHESTIVTEWQGTVSRCKLAIERHTTTGKYKWSMHGKKVKHDTALVYSSYSEARAVMVAYVRLLAPRATIHNKPLKEVIHAFQ